MPIHAVDAGVQLTADEPFREAAASRDLMPWPRPLELAGQSRPMSLGIAVGIGVHAFVTNDGVSAELI
jgi:hypothetical protein